MKPLVQMMTWLCCVVGVGVLTWVAGAWRDADGLAPQRAVWSPSPASMPASGVVHVAEAVLAGPAQSVGRVMATPPNSLPDVSRLQREIQFAFSSDQRGKAGEAARHIKACATLERLHGRTEAGWHHKSEADGRALLTYTQQELVACQAVDAASREQLVPLLRRSLAEGHRGAAASLIVELGAGFDPSAEPDVVAGLRRDSWACDGVSQAILRGSALMHPRLLVPNELGALNELERMRLGARTEQLRRMTDADPKSKVAFDKLMDGLKLPPDADAAEVARLVAEVQARCADKPRS
ncbi:hypothetical protein [Roseateles sp.]|uniref:hypothetical protein n=1 Tax=Roseateles sp. TaxID=1971397 RepID=UPI0039E79B65